MTLVETQLLAALRELEDLARRLPSLNPKPSLLPLFERIEALSRSLAPDTDPQLRHFLSRKSYQKATEWLEGRGASVPKGTCG